MELRENELILCTNCKNELTGKSNFCNHCGQARNHSEITSQPDKKQNLHQIAAFFGIELIICLSALLIENHSLTLTLFYDGLMAIIAICFFSINWQENKLILKWPNFSLKNIAGLVIATILASLIVQFLVANLNQLVFKENSSFYLNYIFHPYGKSIMIVSIALFPALFEELAYRGFLMERLLKVVDEKETIYITSILFFFIHLSIFSFFWMLPLGLILAYVRIKTKTIWYGVIMHFFFNLTACLFEIYNYGDLF